MSRRLRLMLLFALPSLALFATSAARAPRPAIELLETHPVEAALGSAAIADVNAGWLERIRGARRTLDIEQFYISRWPGERLDPILDAIGAAARRGVRVRILVDAAMLRTYPNPADSLGKLRGIAVRRIDYNRIAGGVQHSKFFIVDGEDIVLGSQNFDWRALKHIHEMGISIRDRRVAGAFERVFERDWQAAADTSRRAPTNGEPLPPRVAPPSPEWSVAIARGDTAWVRASASPLSELPDSLDWDRDALVRLIDGARSEVCAQMLSYSLGSRARRDSTIDLALRRAAARGVRVRLVVSDWQADSPRIRDLQSLAAVPGIQVLLSVVPDWSGGYIPFARVEHCKFLVADTLESWVGTSNWGPDYFFESRNIAVTLVHRGLSRQLREAFQRSWELPSSKRVHPDSTYAPRTHREEPPAGAKKYGG